LLRHSSDSEPGITRKRKGPYWAYFDADGNRVTNRDEIDRLNAIGLPPAYEDAWFCADPDGHLQATGVDARGRKQYRYHPDYRAKRESAKYEGLLEFGKTLPKLRGRVERDLNRHALSREAVLAAVVRLLDTQHIRIGNEEYARSEGGRGASTLLKSDVSVDGDQVVLMFKGKGGKEIRRELRDPLLAKARRRGAMVTLLRPPRALVGPDRRALLEPVGERVPFAGAGHQLRGMVSRASDSRSGLQTDRRTREDIHRTAVSFPRRASCRAATRPPH